MDRNKNVLILTDVREGRNASRSVIKNNRKEINVNKRLIIAGGCAAVAAAAVLGVRSYIDHQRTEMVFNEAEIPYEEILDKGLPNGARTDSFQETLMRLLGFDVKEPKSILKSYSSVFGDEEPAAEPSPQVTAEPEKELPSQEEISAATAISVNNATSYSADANALCAEPLEIAPDGDGPQILIMHTHTTECYDGDNMDGETERTTDMEKNVAAVGDRMMEVFESYGIECVHDTTIHDYPTYQGAYTRALETINSDMEKYPSVKLVFDIHRDAYVYKDGTKLKVDCEIDGETTAKAMIVCGTDSMGLYHPFWRENFKLAAKIQNAAQIMYPGLMRPINLRKERFNMHVTEGSLLFEIGSNGNTLDEALRSGEYLARAVSAVLRTR